MSLHDIIAQPPAGAPAAAPAAEPTAENANPVKRSWRRKYRKMRRVFEDRMEMSNSLIKHEYRAKALARRLQEENDQLLDLLLDINDTQRLPDHLRYDLESLDSELPPLEADGIPIGPKSLAALAETPHTHLDSGHLGEEMLEDNAPDYFSPTHEDEYLQSLDTALSDMSPFDASGMPARLLRLPERQIPDDKQLQLRNPDSTYNWLRKHQPQVFLQDKDHENASEKSSARPAGAQRGKRPSTVTLNSTATPIAPKTEQDLLDEEIGFIPESGAGSARAKRSRDDEPYRPKGGSSRPPKRKREDGEKGSARKKVAKTPITTSASAS